MYPEIQAEITRSDGGALATEAIGTAISEVKIYLSRYDLVQLFGDSVAGTSATFTDILLTRMVKDIAAWHLLQLSNPNYLYESAKQRYDQAISTLTRIQKGVGAPQWPIYEPPTKPTTGAGQVIIVNNPLRNTSGFCTQQDLDQ
jgi:hypothetical protein